MNTMIPNKIYIIGSVASGKTTIAKQLSSKLDIPWHELDNVVHIRLKSGDVRRTPEEIDYEFNKILDSDQWIIEGVYRQCFKDGFDKANTIILLDTPSYKRNYRIIKRWLRQRLKLEKSNYDPTIRMLIYMYKWSKSFEKSRNDILNILSLYRYKVRILKHTVDIKLWIDNIN